MCCLGIDLYWGASDPLGIWNHYTPSWVWKIRQVCKCASFYTQSGRHPAFFFFCYFRPSSKQQVILQPTRLNLHNLFVYVCIAVCRREHILWSDVENDLGNSKTEKKNDGGYESYRILLQAVHHCKHHKLKERHVTPGSMFDTERSSNSPHRNQKA